MARDLPVERRRFRQHRRAATRARTWSRRTTSTAFRRISTIAFGRCAAWVRVAIKVAVAVSRLTETLALKRIGDEGDAIVIGMGEAGVPSRLLATHYGSRWTYAGRCGGSGSAAGRDDGRRLSLFPRRARDAYLRRRQHERDALAVAGDAQRRVRGGRHRCGLRAASCLRLRRLPVLSPRRWGSTGASITIPFKLDALRAAARADALTRSVGAANTLRRTADGWEATNTDVSGFLSPLDAVFGARLKGARAAVLGAGGAARAVVVALQSRGATVTVYARRADQARTLAESLAATAGEWPPVAGSWDVLVNCTPIGGAGTRDESPLPRESVSGPLVYDLTYGPGTVGLASRRKDCRVADDRWAADARRAGRATVRVVDGPTT